MYFSQVAAAAAVAHIANAILLPPTISSSDSDIINTLPFEDAVTADGRDLTIACPGCPVAVKDLQGNVQFADVESKLRLNFSVAHGDLDRLMLNGLQIYPIDPQSASFMTPLVADQLVETQDKSWTLASEPKLGYSLNVKHPVQTKQDQFGLVTVHLEIVEVAGKFLDGIPSIDLKLLETPSGKVMLGEAEITAAKSAAPTPKEGDQECTTMICKWRAILADKLSKVKGCAGKMRPHPTAAVEERPKHHGHHGRPHGRPHPHGGHRPFRHHRHRHSIARFLRNIAVHVLIPIFIGITVGITASLVGMVVGNIIVFVWRVLFRRNSAQYTRVQTDEIVVIDEIDDETKGFLAHQGPPPAYVDAAEEEKTAE